MAEAYFTFKGINAGLVDAFYPTQALANAAATDNADIVAHVGVVDVGDLQPNKAYWDGTNILSEIPPTVVFALLPAVDKLKSAARTLHDAYCTLAMRLENPLLAGYFKREHVDWAHDFLAYAHRGTYAVMKADSTNITVAQKLAWAQAQGAGPTDVPPTNRSAYFSVVEDWENDNHVPAEAVLFAHPTRLEDGKVLRWTLADSRGETADADLQALLAVQPDDVDVYINGAWIDGITV